MSSRVNLLAGVMAAAYLGQAPIEAQAVPQNGQMVAKGLTNPYGGVWINGTQGGHWWQPDGGLGVCRIDSAGPGANPPFAPSTVPNACSTVAKSGGQAVVGTSGTTTLLFVSDDSSKSNQVVRFLINTTNETITSNLALTVKPVTNAGGGGTGARPNALVLAQNGADLYVGYIKSGDIMKITNATGTTNGSPAVAKIGSTSDGKGVNSMVMINNNLYLAELGGNGLTTIPDPSGVTRPACSAAAPCTARIPAGIPAGIPSNPAGLASDGTNLYIGDSPLNGTPGIGVVKWNPTTTTVSTFSNDITPSYSATPDGSTFNTYTTYANPIGLGFDPLGNLYVSDDPSFRCAAPCTPPISQGHLWKVAPLPQAPTVTNISPKAGDYLGGTTVTITGTGFSTASGATTVAFGASPSVTAICNTTKSCTAVTPAGTPNTAVDVVVTVGGQSSAISAADQFTYQKVTVTGVSPTSGPAAGGTVVTITGSGFDANLTTIQFGAAAPVSPISCASTTCTVSSPLGTAGTVDILVSVTTTTGKDTSNISPADQFTFTGATSPTVTSLCVVPDSRNIGPPAPGCAGTTGIAAGGTVVQLTGTNLANGTVTFGTASAGIVGGVCAATSCTVITPPSTIGAGNVPVQVAAASGQTSVPVTFTYATPTATVYAFGITAPKGGVVWVPGSLGGHWWSSDHANGFCRLDSVAGVVPAPPSGAPFAINYGVCDDGSIGSPGQAVYDPTAQPNGNHYIYVPDNAVKSTAVWRLTFNPASETIVGAPEAMLPLADVRTLKPNGMALGPGPNGTALYVTDLTEANIRRLDGPAGDPRLQALAIIGTTGDLRGANGTIGFIGNKLYISENRAASWFDVTQCTDNTAKPCSTAITSNSTTVLGITGTVPLPTGVFIAGVATDPVHNLVYAADSPGGAAATIWRFNPGTGLASVVDLTRGTAPTLGPTFACALTCTRPTDGFATGTAFSFAFGINVDPTNGNLMIAEDATAGTRSGRGRAWVSPFIP